jgi:hypothetical protein
MMVDMTVVLSVEMLVDKKVQNLVE